MNSKQIQNLEPNQQQIISNYTTTTTTIHNIQNLNQPFLANNIPQITKTIQETKKIIKNENKEEKKVENSVPFKSLINNGEDINMEEEQEPAFSSKHLSQQNHLFKNNFNNPFGQNLNLNKNSKKENSKTIYNVFSQQVKKNTDDILSNNKIEKYFEKKLKSHDIRNTFNKIHNFEKKNTLKIITFKSQGKQRGRMTTFEKMLISKNGLELNKIIEENEKYRLLIKRIAFQLKRRSRPPTHGFFYKYIQKQQYLLLVKRIAFQLKRKTRPSTRGFFYNYIQNGKYKLLIKKIAFQLKRKKMAPTHGFFYKYIKNEQYKLLIKRIAFQLKRRTKLPTCKIIKIYQPYILLIKKIAGELNKSRKKRLATKTTITTMIIEEKIINDGNSHNNMVINDKEVNNSFNKKGNIYNNNINQNINTVTEISKTEVANSTVNKFPNNINNNYEKIEIEEEEKKPEIYEYQHKNIYTINNLERNNISNNEALNIDNNKKESSHNSMHNSINMSEENFSFGQNSIKNNEELNQDIHMVTEKFESINKNGNDKNIQLRRSHPILDYKEDPSSNKSINSKNEVNLVQSYPCSKKKKNININLSSFKKEGSIRKENNLNLLKEKNEQNRNFEKETKILSEINGDINICDDKEQDLNISQDLNMSLSNFEVSKSNFIHEFTEFLNKFNIKIVNNFPVSLNEKNKHYFHQNKFWQLIMNYLFLKNNNLSLYTIVSLLEQYFLWCTNINLQNFTSIKERIKEYINSNFSPETISQFLFMNQLKSIDDIFEKYENCIKKQEIYYKEIKISNINLQNNGEIKCNCDLCTNDNSCIRKVIDINKNKVNVINNINMDILAKNKIFPKYDQKINDISNNEEIFLKGKSKKNKTIFSKSKTMYSENSNLEYNIINQNLNRNDNFEEILENNEEKDKTYKNISKKKGKRKEKGKNDNDKEEKEEKADKEEKEEKEEKVEKEEKEENDSDNKNKKKIKRTKKTKSRSRNKKKKDSTTSDKEENENEEKEEDEKNEEKEKKEEKSKSKKKKVDKKRNKSSEKKDSEEKEERVEREIKEERKEKEEEEDLNNANNSKRKKSKTPNKKRNKKH